MERRNYAPILTESEGERWVFELEGDGDGSRILAGQGELHHRLELDEGERRARDPPFIIASPEVADLRNGIVRRDDGPLDGVRRIGEPLVEARRRRF